MCHSADCPCRIVGNRPTNHLLEKGSRLFWAGRERNGGCHARSHRPNCADGSIGVEQLEPHVDIGSVDLSIEHRRFKRGTANMAAPFRGFLTSHNGASVNFLGDGTIFWGDGTEALCGIRRGRRRLARYRRRDRSPCDGRGDPRRDLRSFRSRLHCS